MCVGVCVCVLVQICVRLLVCVCIGTDLCMCLTVLCCLFVCLFVFFYVIATVLQSYHGGDLIYEMRRRNPVPKLVLTQVIFNLPHHIGMV